MKNIFKKKSSGDWKKKNNKGGYKGGSRSGGGNSWDRGGQGGSQGMHKAVCSKCDSSCEVPFKPNGRKPILCSDCFRREGGGSSSRRDEQRYDRPRASEKPAYQSTPRGGDVEVSKQLRILNEKMDQILEALMDLGE